MDAEGLGRKLLLTRSGKPVTASHNMLTLQALSSSLNSCTGAWAEEGLLGDLWQSVPQNGRVHLLGIEGNSDRSGLNGVPERDF